MSAVAELRGLVADRLVWWAWRLDRERFLAIDEKGRPVIDAADLYYSERQLLKRCPESWVALARVARLREEVRTLESYREWAVDERDRWIRLFNRLEAAVVHHRKAASEMFGAGDEALWAAHKSILKDAAAFDARSLAETAAQNQPEPSSEAPR